MRYILLTVFGLLSPDDPGTKLAESGYKERGRLLKYAAVGVAQVGRGVIKIPWVLSLVVQSNG